MLPNERAQNEHKRLFPDHVSKLAVSDPELSAFFDNFAFDEVLQHGNVNPFPTSEWPKRSWLLHEGFLNA